MDPFCANKPTRRVWIAAIIVTLAALALRLCFVRILYDDDSELFVYMGKLVSQGGRIGIELIDNKLPTVGLLMFGPYELLGNWWVGYALLSILMGIGSVLAVTRAAALVYPSSRWPTLAIAAIWMGFPLLVFSSFKLEHVQLLTGSLAAMAFVQCWRSRDWRDAFTVGLCAGLGAMAKPTAFSVCVAAGVALAVWTAVPWRQRAKLLLAMLAGVAIPVAVVTLYLYGSGAIRALPALCEQISLYGHNSIWLPGIVAMKFGVMLLLFSVPTLMRLFLERRSREPLCAEHHVLLVFAAAWVLVEGVGIGMQGRMYGYHFLPLAAPAALLFALIPRQARAITVLGSALPILAVSAIWTYGAVLDSNPPADRLAAIAYIKSHANPNDSAWMDDTARLLVEADVHPGSRVPLTFIFSNDDDAPQHFGQMMLHDFQERSPKWMVLSNQWADRVTYMCDKLPELAKRPKRAEHYVQAWDALAGYIKAHYTPVALCGAQCIYQLDDSPLNDRRTAQRPANHAQANHIQLSSLDH